MRKRILTLALALFCCAGLFPASTAASGAPFPFADVSPEAWYFEDVKTAAESGLVNGRSETEFCPDDCLTWAEAVKLAACMNQLRTVGEITLENGDPWYAPYVEYAKSAGIIAGDYAWDEPVTRADYMAIFARALPEGDYAEIINAIPRGGLPDVDGNAPLAGEIYKLARSGIVQGDENHRVNPGDPIRRCEVAAILTRMMHPDTRVSFWKGLSGIDAAGVQSFVGLWNDLTSQRASMSIMSSEEYPYYDVTLHWGDSASSAGEWTMKASFDETTGRLVYENGEMAYMTYDETGKGVRDKKWDDGTGSFFWSADGILMWEDSREERSAAFRFERSLTPAPTAEELADGFFRVISGIEIGTADASLKQAAAISEVMRFANRSSIWAAYNVELRTNILAAWNTLTPEEQAAFDGNFISVLTAARSAKANWDENKGVFEDAGVAEVMAELLADRGAWLSWETLTSNTLTMGNSDGSENGG